LPVTSISESNAVMALVINPVVRPKLTVVLVGSVLRCVSSLFFAFFSYYLFRRNLKVIWKPGLSSIL